MDKQLVLKPTFRKRCLDPQKVLLDFLDGRDLRTVMLDRVLLWIDECAGSSLPFQINGSCYPFNS